ncbi:M55 family metallopeptidase [Advenella mimigardefordensis]|uniref:Putative D-aminopeptidase n=1 Tax=Advenella mimigardefordensis (strain DSM 17166 / LMG 22922 / DPN7) TaxID=1247726 RepID=W0PBA9_ADVMD|nr:M55 family metallopeptidase [Advenella mimigardefordensis]AHG62695.1 putative D-aminopeptidase [Advenella mimigardefordensis DPN7]
MKILISTDIEGVAGVVDSQQVRAGNVEYERARQWMTAEANAAIAGAFDGGATAVYVNDSHGGFRNMIASDIDARATLITGKPRVYSMMTGLEFGVNAVALVGHHSRAQGRGVLAHTINSFAFARVMVNGIELGEPGLYGALAGQAGVPVIFGSGDQVFVEENKDFFDGAVWVETKQAMGHASAATLTPQAACARIREGMSRAVQAGKTQALTPFVIGAPYECRLQTNSPALADTFCILPGTERVDGVTLSFKAESIEYVIRTLNVFSTMSVALR